MSNPLMLMPKLSGVTNAGNLVNKGKSNSKIFRELAEKLQVDLFEATRRSARASSAGIDTRIPENMEKAIRGDFEKLYDVKLPKEKSTRGRGNMVAHYSQVHKRAFSVKA